jgi:tetratricopeptide (TPR) repeat protein
MDNIRELEKIWFRYKRRGVVRVTTAFSLVTLLTGGSYYLFSNQEMSKNFLAETMLFSKGELNSSVVKKEPLLVKEITENNLSNESKRVEVATLVKSEPTKEALYEVSIEPVIPIVDMERERGRVVVSKPKHKSSSRRHPRPIVKAKSSTYLTASELATINHSMDTQKIKKIELHATSANYIETMKEKFAKSKHSREALLIAKAYYSEGDYNKAEEWALKANNLDSSLGESWYLFAKAKAKQGQKDEAIKVLASYYKKSHAPKAKVLMTKIETERL